MSYSTDADVLPLLPSGGLPSGARVARGSASSDCIELGGHGFIAGQEVIFSADAGYSVPTGLTAGVTYYVIASGLTQSRFKVSASLGGAAIDLTSDGDNFAVWSENPISAWREWAARQIDLQLPDDKRPIVAAEDGSYPGVIVQIEAELAAALGVSITGGAELRKDLDAKLESIPRRLKDWLRTMPLRNENASRTFPANLAIVATTSAEDSRGWGRTCGGREVIP